MSSDVRIETERFLIRGLGEADATPVYLGWLADPSIQRYILAASDTTDIDDLRAYIADKAHRTDTLFLGIFTKDGGRHIGNIKYEGIDRTIGQATLGLLIGDRAWQGVGVAQEVIQATAEFLDVNLSIAKLYLAVHRENASAIRAYRKLGFQDETIYPSGISPRTDHFLMALHRRQSPPVASAAVASTAGANTSNRYQDYVIREGRFIGRFEDMYRYSADVPWHQDRTAFSILSDHTVSILKRRAATSLLDVGCGLGYMAERLRLELPALQRVVGIDVSATAVAKARALFPHIEFFAGTLADFPRRERYDVVVSKDVLWYVLDDLPGYLAGLAHCSHRWVYIGNSFPAQRPFYGDDVLPDPVALFAYLRNAGYEVVYSLIECDADYGGREYAHALIRIGDGDSRSNA